MSRFGLLVLFAVVLLFGYGIVSKHPGGLESFFAGRTSIEADPKIIIPIAGVERETATPGTADSETSTRAYSIEKK